MRWFRRWRRKVACRRKYGDRCPHIERHSPRRRAETVPVRPHRSADTPADR